MDWWVKANEKRIEYCTGMTYSKWTWRRQPIYSFQYWPSSESRIRSWNLHDQPITELLIFTREGKCEFQSTNLPSLWNANTLQILIHPRVR
jgi:hypothetical protein